MVVNVNRLSFKDHESVRAFVKVILRVGSFQQHLCLKHIKLQLIEGVLLLFLGREMGILKQSLNDGAIDIYKDIRLKREQG